MGIMLLPALGLSAYLLLGPPRWLDRIASGWSAGAIAIPAFSSYLLQPEADYCLTGAPLAARLGFQAPCWLQLWRGGQKVAERTFRPGDVFELDGYQLTLVIANPPALRLSINGREVTYFRSSPTALKLVVNPGNLQEILQR